MKIEVKQVYIDAGVRSDCVRCPIALAMLGEHAHPMTVWPHFPHFENGVGGYMQSGYYGTKYKLPEAANKFAVDFDNGRPVKPFSFELDI